MFKRKFGLFALPALAGTALALAVPPTFAASAYSVSLSVPSTVSGATVKVKATGTSQSTSRLTVYIANKCASSLGAEAAMSSARRVINKDVSRSYTATKNAKSGTAGSHRVCAYLTSTSGSSLRAHASSTYYALTGAY